MTGSRSRSYDRIPLSASTLLLLIPAIRITSTYLLPIVFTCEYYLSITCESFSEKNGASWHSVPEFSVLANRRLGFGRQSLSNVQPRFSHPATSFPMGSLVPQHQSSSFRVRSNLLVTAASCLVEIFTFMSGNGETLERKITPWPNHTVCSAFVPGSIEVVKLLFVLWPQFGTC